MTGYSAIAALCTVTLIICAFLAYIRKIEGQHFTPVSAWLLSWSVLFILSTVFGSVYDYTLSGLLAMLFLILSFAIGGMAAYLMLGGLDGRAQVITFRAPLQIEIAGIAAGIFGAFELRKSFSKAGFGSDDSLASAAANASALYSGEYTLPLTANLGYSFLLIASYFSVMRAVVSGRKKTGYFLLVLTLATSLLWTFTTTTRIYFGMVLLWSFCTFLSARVLIKKPIDMLEKNVARLTVTVLIPFIFFILFVQGVRLNNGFFGGFAEAFDHMRPWFGGTIPAFCAWFDLSWDDEHTYGTYLFRALFKIVGFETQDKFENYSIGNGDLSNATTMLRGAVQDFGIIGGALFVAIMGFFSIKAYKDTLSGSPFAGVFLLMFFVISLFAPNNFAFLYGSRIYALVMIYAAIVFLRNSGKIRRAAYPTATQIAYLNARK